MESTVLVIHTTLMTTELLVPCVVTYLTKPHPGMPRHTLCVAVALPLRRTVVVPLGATALG